MERVECQEDFDHFSNVKSSHFSFVSEIFNKRNCIENLSNEIFYDIFDYLDGYDIYQAFSNLNIRFQNLVINSLFLMKIQLSSSTIFNSRYKQFLDSNKHRIISFHFSHEPILDHFITFYTIDSSFLHLQSFVLNEISIYKLVILLFYLKSLPQFFSLIISFEDSYDNIGDIYRMIFHLPVLKFFKIKIPEAEQLEIDIPIANNDHFFSLKYLVIHHYCTLNQLTDLLSYTPRLSHLYCSNVNRLEDDIKSEVLIKLMNLVHLTIDMCDVTLDEFEEFLLNLCSQLQLLNVTFQAEDKNLLDVSRWERLILKNMSYLKEFYFSYIDFIYDLEFDSCYSLINQFSSSFWIERQWIFGLLIEDLYITYLIRPHQTLKYDFQEHIHIPVINDQMTRTNSPLHCFPGAYLNIKSSLRTLENPSSNRISPILKLIEISRLDIKCNQMSVNILMNLLNLLPNLDAIRLVDLPSDAEMYQCDLDTDDMDKFLKNNKITKLTLNNPTETQIYFIIDLFPRIQSFALQNIRDIDFELIIRCILSKIKEKNICHSMILCIFGVEAEYDKEQKLKQMIDSENLLKDYTIHRRCDQFYLQWKSY